MTSLDTPCPGEFIGDPCLTLQQYVSNPSISSENITLLFECGNHTISSTLSSSNANNFTMSGNNIEVQCSSSAIQITLTSVQHVHISGVSFTGCGSRLVAYWVPMAGVFIIWTMYPFIGVMALQFETCHMVLT